MASVSAASTEPAELPVRWQLWDDITLRTPAAQVALDDTLLERAIADGTGFARIWSNRRCLVAPPGEVHRAGFAAACAHSARAGWPVVSRSSGGTVVPHTPGILHLSLAVSYPIGLAPGIEACYRHLCAPVIATLASFGIAAAPGAVAGAFCDGRFNLVAGGRKIAGTAQRRRRLAAHEAVLSQLMLLIDGDIGTAVAAANAFYAASGRNVPFRTDAVIGLHALVSPTFMRNTEPLLPAARKTLLAEAGRALGASMATDMP